MHDTGSSSSPLLCSDLTSTLPACVESAEVFQHPLLEEPPASGSNPAERRAYQQLRASAAAVCDGCPLLSQCLYTAVVEHDVAGFVAGTTPKERAQLRRRLGVVVAVEDFDTLAGVSGGHRQVDHDEVLRLRRANPDESLETIARRLGCSLSTVKRHLRRARAEASGTRSVAPIRRVLPSAGQVMATLAAIRGAARPTVGQVTKAA